MAGKGTKKWALVLHLYQPPTQDEKIVREVLYRSYLPLLQLLADRPEAHLTLNVSGSLLRLLGRVEAGEFFFKARRLIENGQIELLNSPVNHVVIPITPFSVVKRQLETNRDVVKEFLGVYPGDGLFMPELAVDKESLEEVSGYRKYCVVDQEAIGKKNIVVGEWGKAKLVINQREVCETLRTYPGRINPVKFMAWLEETTKGNDALVSVSDAELFGHHYEERGELLRDLLYSGSYKFVTLSELVDSEKGEKVEVLKPSTWQAKVWEGESAFDLWLEKDNILQQKYYQLATLATNLIDQIKPEGISGDAARKHLDVGWSSCNLYWLSNKPWWHPDLVEQGANNLIKSIRSLPGLLEEKKKAESLYHQFLNEMWNYHWSGEVEKKYREYEEKRKGLLSKLPQL